MRQGRPAAELREDLLLEEDVGSHPVRRGEGRHAARRVRALLEDVLSAESAMRILDELKEKELLDGEGFSYTLSPKGKSFSFDAVKDTVSFLRENPGAGSAALLFVYKPDRI